VQQTFAHLLPFPADPGVPGMPRIAIEAVVTAPFGDVRVITTHLEYYGRARRTAQVEALRAIYAEGAAHACDPSPTKDDGGPFESLPRPAATIITGDFNLEYPDPLHARMVAPFADATPPLADAWDVAHPGEPYPPTFRIYEKEHPDQAAYACDFVFVSDGLRPRLRSVVVDTVTQISDHQPVIVTLE
jgi:endonuclease/exonuclease/phosphatase family metal-dependent hydrolase